ncbi:MAG TPA: VOC family protein [Cyclobacteriaceae bacterium]|nr:VOC family protein [Cyclobacteriaceae bacterium]
MKSIFHQPVPELPVRDVEVAQKFYRDKMGFAIAWADTASGMSGIFKDEASFFLKQYASVAPIKLWIFVDNVDDTYTECKKAFITILEHIETKPWGLRQFIMEDPDGNKIIFHHDV